MIYETHESHLSARGSSAMRVGLDAYHTLFPAGGIARYGRALITALVDQAPGDRFVLFCNRFREKARAWRPARPNVTIRQVRLPRSWLQGLWDSVDRPRIETLCGSLDVFHGLHFMLPPARRAKRVLTVHDLTYLKFPEYFSERRLNERGYRHELPRGLARADLVIAVSHRTREDLLEVMGFAPDRVRVVYEGVDKRLFRPIEPSYGDRLRRLYGLTEPYVVYLVGTPEPRKNLLRAVEAVRRSEPRPLLALIGSKERLRRLVGVTDPLIVFVGVVPEEHLAPLVGAAELSFYPSLYEGFGLPVLESMACGTPVVCSDRGSLPEVAGGAAMLVDPENVEEMAHAVSRVLTDQGLRGRLKSLCTLRASEFSWEKSAAQTLSLYRALV